VFKVSTVELLQPFIIVICLLRQIDAKFYHKDRNFDQVLSNLHSIDFGVDVHLLAAPVLSFDVAIFFLLIVKFSLISVSISKSFYNKFSEFLTVLLSLVQQKLCVAFG
jgi:hypothetical protein